MDDADRADERSALSDAARIEELRRAAAKIPEGHPGECDRCGEDMPRLVLCEDPKTHDLLNACARCRDKHKLILRETKEETR